MGIRVSASSTWDATLVRDPRVLVPIHVDCLAVRDGEGAWADCRFRTAAEATGNESGDRLAPPFTDRDAPRAPGIYLHWSVPDAVSTVVGAGPDAQPSVLPDRWLVVRLAPRGHSRELRAWVLDSRLGVTKSLADWRGGRPTGKPLTALGAGDAGWVGYFDNTEGRLGFHDPVEGVVGPLAYLVCGWYADAEQDPLAARGRDAVGFKARLDALGWDLDAQTLVRAQTISQEEQARAAKGGLVTPRASRGADGVVRMAGARTPVIGTSSPGGLKTVTTVGPQVCLFHGAAMGVGWPHPVRAGDEFGGPPSAGGVRISLGQSPGEALAVLVGQDAELLTAFAHGALSEAGRPDGPAHVADRIHDAGFVGHPGLTYTVDRPAPRKEPSAKKQVSRVHSRRGVAWMPATEMPAVVTSKARGPREEPTRVSQPGPRSFSPADPVLAVTGVSRSFKHGGDRRFGGALRCRLTGDPVDHLVITHELDQVVIRAEDLLGSALDHGGLPPECAQLLGELALLDPGGGALVTTVARARAPRIQDVGLRVEVEQTAWWALRRSDVAGSEILARSGLRGVLPSPIALRPPQRPWVPLHLDWELEYRPAPASAWTLGETEFVPPAVTTTVSDVFRGRVLLSAGASNALSLSMKEVLRQAEAADTSSATATGTSAAARGLLDDNDVDEAALEDLAARLGTLDILSGGVEHLHRRLRRRVPLTPPAGPAPEPPPGFVGVRSGFLRFTRLRLVDAFGQYVDLDPARVEVAPSLASRTAGVAALAPRFTARAQLHFRFVAPAGGDAGAASPVCGWLLPDHLDGALEVFEADGTPVGQLRALGEYGTAWEPAPGRAAAYGERPGERITDPRMRALVSRVFEESLVDGAAGEESALSALLRVIDTTRWTVDPFAHTGEEHLALLLGHPVAVVGAELRLDVAEVAAGGAPPTRVPVRLGALTHWKDGLFAFVVDDDVGRIRVASDALDLARPPAQRGFAGPVDQVPDYAATFTEVSEPVQHRLFDGSQSVWVVPGRTYRLLLLIEPHTSVHATTGLLPRKELGLRREWMAPPLGALAPTFRFGPVLRDPKQVRMPIPADLGGAWTWTHRADVDRWAEEPVTHVGHEALLPPDPADAEEGWLRFTPEPEKP